MADDVKLENGRPPSVLRKHARVVLTISLASSSRQANAEQWFAGFAGRYRRRVHAVVDRTFNAVERLSNSLLRYGLADFKAGHSAAPCRTALPNLSVLSRFAGAKRPACDDDDGTCASKRRRVDIHASSHQGASSGIATPLRPGSQP